MAGNIQTIEESMATNELIYTDGDISFSEGQWKSNKYSIKLSTLTYKLKYQIVKENENIRNDELSWSEAVTTGYIVENMEHGDTLCVKLYDGKNASIAYATYNVINPMKINYNTLTEEQVKNITFGSYDILTYSVETEKTKVAISAKNNNTITYNYYTKDIQDETYKLMMTTSFYDEQVEIKQLKEAHTYNTICIALINNTTGTLYKSKNKAVTVANDEIVAGSTKQRSATYIDSENYTATIPEGFKVSEKSGENIISKGLVISDEDNNEFVWIPVDNAIYDEKTSVGISQDYTPMVRTQKDNVNYYERLYYAPGGVAYISTQYRLGSSYYIEPAVITGNELDRYTWNVQDVVGTEYDAKKENLEVLGYNTINEFGKELNEYYTKNIISIDDFGGFYCGRYEVTVTNGKYGSVKGSNILNNNTWYELYKKLNSDKTIENTYHNSRNVYTTMMSGTSYDAIINFILRGEDKELITNTNLGNKTNEIAVSGHFEDDKMNNIYDLASNAFEFTTESFLTYNRVYRGRKFHDKPIRKKCIYKRIYKTTRNIIRIKFKIKYVYIRHRRHSSTNIYSTSNTTNKLNNSKCRCNR